MTQPILPIFMTQPLFPLSAQRKELIIECERLQNELDEELKIRSGIIFVASIVSTIALALFLILGTSVNPWFLCVIVPASFVVLNCVLFPELFLPFDPHPYLKIAVALRSNEDFSRHLDQVQTPINIHTIYTIYRDYENSKYQGDFREFHRLP